MMERLFAIQETLRQVFDDDGLIVAPDTKLRDIADWDSVMHVKLILSLEEEFAVRFTEDEVSSARSIGDMLTAIENHKGRNQ